MKKNVSMRFFASIVFLMMAIATWAQTKEAAYPAGSWQTTDYESGIVMLEISRTANSDGNCGTFSYEGGEGNINSPLKYKGSAADNNYIFEVKVNGATETIQVKKYRTDGTIHVQLTEVSDGLKNMPGIGDEMILIVGNGSAYDPTFDVMTEEELQNAVKEARENDLRADGFMENEESGNLTSESSSYSSESDNYSSESSSSSSSSSRSSGSSQSLGETILGILLLLAILFMFFHMLYVLFWPRVFEMIYKKKHPSVIWKTTVDEQMALRREEGLPETMPDSETDMYVDKLNQVFDTWTPVPGETDQWIITTKKQMDESRAAIREALDAHVTDPDVVARINELVDCVESSSKRLFDGSKVMVWITIIFAGIMWYASGFQSSLFFFLSLGLYYMASLKPVFMIDHRTFKGSSGRGALNWLLGGVFGMILGAQTVRTVTKWSDGTTTTDDDHTQHLVAWAIAIIVMVILVIFLFVWSLVNWLRNYVIYK